MDDPDLEGFLDCPEGEEMVNGSCVPVEGFCDESEKDADGNCPE